MKNVLIVLFFCISAVGFAQSGKQSPISYVTPSKDTLFLQNNNNITTFIKKLWDENQFSEPKKPVILMVDDISLVIAQRRRSR